MFHDTLLLWSLSQYINTLETLKPYINTHEVETAKKKRKSGVWYDNMAAQGQLPRVSHSSGYSYSSKYRHQQWNKETLTAHIMMNVGWHIQIHVEIFLS